MHERKTRGCFDSRKRALTPPSLNPNPAAPRPHCNRNSPSLFRGGISGPAWAGHSEGNRHMRMLSGTAIALVLLACPALAAERDVRSAIDNVIVYPDGATVTRVIEADLPPATARCSRAIFRPGSIRRRCGSKARAGAARHRRDRRAAAARGTAAVVAGTRKPHRSAERRARRARRQDRGRDGAQEIRRAICGTIARRHRRQGRGAAARGMARGFRRDRGGSRRGRRDRCARRRSKQREIDRELARLEAQRNANPPRKMEVRIDLAADAATQRDAARELFGARRALVADLRRAARYRHARSQAGARTRSAAPRSCRTPARTGATSRSRSRPCAPPRAATRRTCVR